MKYVISFLYLSTIYLYATPAHKEQSSWKDIKVIQDLIQSSHRVIDEIKPIDLMTQIEDGDDFVLIDIREPGQRGHGDIDHDNIVEIVRGYLEFKIENHIEDKKIPIVVYCCSGKRSILGARTLLEMGYKNVRSLKGGIQGWIKSGMPLYTHYGEMIQKPDNYIIPNNNTKNKE